MLTAKQIPSKWSQVTATVLAASICGVSACGSDDEPPRRGVDSAGPSPPERDRLPGANSANPPGEGRARTVPTPGGGIAILAPKPRATVVRPGRACKRVTAADGSSVRLPPQPGLRAVRVTDERVRVSYRFVRLPDGCRPASLLVTLDVNDDARPGRTSEHAARHRGSLDLAVPSFLTTPDVVHASAFTANGLRSATVSVRIRPSSTR